MRGERVRWILAFDSGCARCRALAISVHEACQGGLEILPLDHSDVQRWASQARPGRQIAWTPTLFRLRGTSVRMWTGRALSARLVLHLGPMASGRVLRVIGAAPTVPSAADSTESLGVHTTPGNTTRRRFLELAGGAAMAAGIIITGAVPAGADPIDSWLRANRHQLPRTYAGLVALPLAFRSAAYQEMTAAERSAAWVAHLTSNRAPTLTGEQSSVIVAALALAANPANFNGGPAPPAIAALAGRSTAAFGIDRARAIFATLGPDEATANAKTTASSNVTAQSSNVTPQATAAVAASCQCSTVSNYCGGRCQSGGCTARSPGCGFLYQYACNGHCV